LPGDADSARALKLARGYLAFGLTERAYELTRTYGETFPGEFVEEAARRAAAEGNLITAIRLAGRVRSEEFRRELAELRYPLGFAADVDAVVEMYGLDGAIFYGLIREESHFSASIVSHAGAVGLAQLMPATARDVARRMRLGDYELTDPATNLALGAHYLAYLKGRFPTYLHALAAYNGGQGRVRRWMERFGLDGILFHEAIPLLETRHYVRKVVVSAAYYGYLYDDREPAEIVQPIFPNVGARSSAERRNPGGTPGS
jgi:soluble lytic murein transglycosylase